MYHHITLSDAAGLRALDRPTIKRNRQKDVGSENEVEGIHIDLARIIPNEVEGIDNAPVIIRHLSIGITFVTVMKLIMTNNFNLIHTKK